MMEKLIVLDYTSGIAYVLDKPDFNSFLHQDISEQVDEFIYNKYNLKPSDYNWMFTNKITFS